MINTIVELSQIDYEYSEPSKTLLESIRQRGMAIPVQVNVLENGRYQCLDGRKRLSACAFLAKTDPKFEKVEVMLMNDYSKAGSSYWGNTLNHH